MKMASFPSSEPDLEMASFSPIDFLHLIYVPLSMFKVFIFYIYNQPKITSVFQVKGHLWTLTWTKFYGSSHD